MIESIKKLKECSIDINRGCNGPFGCRMKVIKVLLGCNYIDLYDMQEHTRLM